MKRSPASTDRDRENRSQKTDDQHLTGSQSLEPLQIPFYFKAKFKDSVKKTEESEKQADS